MDTATISEQAAIKTAGSFPQDVSLASYDLSRDSEREKNKKHMHRVEKNTLKTQ